MPDPAGKIKSTPAMVIWDEGDNNCEVNFGTGDDSKPRSLRTLEVITFLEEAKIPTSIVASVAEKHPWQGAVQKIRLENVGDFQIPVAVFAQQVNNKFSKIAKDIAEASQKKARPLKQYAPALSSPPSVHPAAVKPPPQAVDPRFEKVKGTFYALRKIDRKTQDPTVTAAREALLKELYNNDGKSVSSASMNKLRDAYAGIRGKQCDPDREAGQDIRSMRLAYKKAVSFSKKFPGIG